jgi:hypothetical protein
MWRFIVSAGAALPVAAAAIARDKAATVQASTPTIWNLLGYPFEAGSMIAGLCACLAVRFYVSQEARKDHRWNVDLPVSVLTLLFTAGMIIRLRPEPFWALVYGTGLGSAGVLIISACLAWVKRGSDLFQPPEKPDNGRRTDPADETAINKAMGDRHKID